MSINQNVKKGLGSNVLNQTGQYATEAEAVKVKNAPLIALLKKLDVKAAPKA